MRLLLNRGHVRLRLILAISLGSRGLGEVARRAGVDRQVARITLGRLTEAGLVKQERDGFHLTARGSRELRLLREALGIGAVA